MSLVREYVFFQATTPFFNVTCQNGDVYNIPGQNGWPVCTQKTTTVTPGKYIYLTIQWDIAYSLKITRKST